MSPDFRVFIKMPEEWVEILTKYRPKLVEKLHMVEVWDKLRSKRILTKQVQADIQVKQLLGPRAQIM